MATNNIKGKSFALALLEPQEDVNYDAVCAMYACGSLFSLFFYAINKIFPDFGEGFWIIGAPFIPCLCFFLFIRSKWRNKIALIEEEKRDKGTLYGLNLKDD
jgi:hypothetical protein